MDERSAGVRAVVWRATAMPADLTGALARQGISWEEARGPFDALSRILATRADTRQPRVLLLVEPDSLPLADEIRAAMQRFDPQTGCWAYRGAGSPRLAPLKPPTPAQEPEVVVRPAPAPRSQPDLRLAGDGDRADPEPTAQAQNGPEPEPRSPRSLLTAEELAMLLADDL